MRGVVCLVVVVVESGSADLPERPLCVLIDLSDPTTLFSIVTAFAVPSASKLASISI